MNKSCYILGVGGSTALFIELAEACGYMVEGLFHYNESRTGEIYHGIEILGSFNDLYKENLKNTNIVLSMGDMQIRKQLTEILLSKGAIIPTLIHPSAIISKFSNISTVGVIIGAGCIIQSDVIIKSNSIIRDMALVCHEAIVDCYCFIGPKALVGAHSNILEFSFIGQGAIIISGKVSLVGKNSVIGAGSVVSHDIPDQVLAVGLPARVIKKLE